MGWRLTEQGGEGVGDREVLSEARRSIAGARTRLEELADRLRELGDRLGEGDQPDSPERDPGSSSSDDQRGPRSPS